MFMCTNHMYLIHVYKMYTYNNTYLCIYTYIYTYVYNVYIYIYTYIRTLCAYFLSLPLWSYC